MVTTAEMRALDRATSELGIPGFTLMETAGRGVAAVAIAMTRDNPTAPIAVICGPGNNGGDGFVVARVLHAAGRAATAYLTVAREVVGGDALTHLDVLERTGGVVCSLANADELAEHSGAIGEAALVVDALLGIGTTRSVEGHFAAVVAVINRAAQRLAVDIPSGLCSDSGRTLGVAVSAHRTVTMAAHKVGLVSSPGFANCGAIDVVDIGVPPAVIATANVRAGLITADDVRAGLPKVSLLDHKGTRGHLAVAAGPQLGGAARLAAISGLRAGAGLATVISQSPIAVADPIMVQVTDQLATAVAGKQALVIGPGLGSGAVASAWLTSALASGVALVVDADALTLASSDPQQLARASGPVVITPHPGEAARLLATTTAIVEADRLAAARALASATRAVVVLKGARTVICDGTLDDDFCAINSTGSPALATAGSGDVLAGVIGGLIAQGVAPIDAARTAVFVHGMAGSITARQLGERGVIASDLPTVIATSLGELRLSDQNGSTQRSVSAAPT